MLKGNTVYDLMYGEGRIMANDDKYIDILFPMNSENTILFSLDGYIVDIFTRVKHDVRTLFFTKDEYDKAVNYLNSLNKKDIDLNIKQKQSCKIYKDSKERYHLEIYKYSAVAERMLRGDNKTFEPTSYIVNLNMENFYNLIDIEEVFENGSIYIRDRDIHLLILNDDVLIGKLK